MARFVLVHGAWSDAAAWAQVADRLRAGGHSVAAPRSARARRGRDTTVRLHPGLAGLRGQLARPEPLRSYLHTTADKAVPLASQQEMVAAAGGVEATRSLATSHLPMLSDPDGLAAALLDLAG